jgi:hypothetical protein
MKMIKVKQAYRDAKDAEEAKALIELCSGKSPFLLNDKHTGSHDKEPNFKNETDSGRYVQQFYDDKRIQVDNTTEDLGLYIIDKGIYIDGEVKDVKKSSDSIVINGLEGRLSIAKDREYAIKSTKGSIVGDVANGGTIITSTGDLGITIRVPLEVIINTPQGEIYTKGMKTEKESVFVPADGEKPIGTLYLTSETGGIYVTYKRKGD